MGRSRSSYSNALALVFLTAACLTGCATESALHVRQPYIPEKYKAVRIEPCVDRTGHFGERDIAAEATRTLTAKIADSKLFEIREDAPLVLTCEIERFEEGSAFKRWLWPGWGGTYAWISVTAWEQPGQKVLALMRSRSDVKWGGVYTIGAGNYIFDVAFDDIINQLRAWVEGKAPVK